MDTAKLAPTVRRKVAEPEPSAISLPSRSDSRIVRIGMKNRAMPRPIISRVRATAQKSTSVLKLPKRKQTNPITMKENAVIQRKSTLCAYFPTQNVNRIGITPIGAEAKPDHSAVYPNTFCSHSGTINWMEKNRANARISVSVPVAQFRCRNSHRSTRGSSSVSSQITHTEREMVATIASTTMVTELNQSSSLPLSSMICSETTPTISVIMPTQSMRTRRNCSTFLPICASTTLAVNIPIGTLMKKIHRHEYESVIQPPAIGPTIGATTVIMAMMASAIPRLSLG